MFAELLRLLKRLWPITVLATTMGAASGIATAALLAATNRALHDGAAALPTLLWSFAGLCVLALAGEVISDIGNNLVGQRVIAMLRKSLCEKIMTAPIGQIETFRTHKLITALNQDIDTISTFSFIFSSLAIATATIVGCLGYLFFLSPLMLVAALIAIALGSAVQTLARRVGLRRFGAAREAEDRLQKHYRSITDGAKELRLNGQRRSFVYEHELSGTIEAIFTLRLRAANIFVSANAFGSLLFFMLVGLMLTFQSWSPDTDRTVITGFVLVLLYMKGPIQEIVGSLPAIGRAQVAFQRIAELSARFSTREPSLIHAGEKHASMDDATRRRVRHDRAGRCALSFREAARRTRYAGSGRRRLRTRSGEPDNRAWRDAFYCRRKRLRQNHADQTAARSLSARCRALLLNGEPMRDEHLDDYRQLFSAVFSDYYLFDTLIPGEAELTAEAQK